MIDGEAELVHPCSNFSSDFCSDGLENRRFYSPAFVENTFKLVDIVKFYDHHENPRGHPFA
jgi:hypothetical protein